MAEPLAEQVIRGTEECSGLYHRLVLLVGAVGTGKTSVLRDVHERLGAPLLNLNLELSLRLLDLAERQRALYVHQLLSDVLEEHDAGVVLLDNTEILFDVMLKQDSLRLLQALSRNRTIVAAWSGSLERGRLTYAAPNHPEFRQFPAGDLLVVSTTGTSPKPEPATAGGTNDEVP